MNTTRLTFALATLCSFSALTSSADAAIITLNLQGKGGVGLLAGNENGTVTGAFGRGGEVDAGIVFNDVTFVLTIDVGWGTANGFTNLTGNATAGHIHGPTTSSGTASFTENAPVLIGLDDKAGWNPSASTGGFDGAVTLTSAQATQLLAGRLYINIHTSTNGGGEIRGNIVIPEPASGALVGVCGTVLALRRRRKP